MPDNNNAQKKRKKNLIVLAMIFGWIILIWLITMARIASANDQDIDKLFLDQRAAYVERSHKTLKDWDKSRAAHTGQSAKTMAIWDKERETYQGTIENSHGRMQKEGTIHQAKADKTHEIMQKEGAVHRDQLVDRSEKWADNWQPKNYND